MPAPITVTLREYADADLARLVTLANNENVSRYLVYTFPYPYTRDDAEWWIGTGSKQSGGKKAGITSIFIILRGTVTWINCESRGPRRVVLLIRSRSLLPAVEVRQSVRDRRFDTNSRKSSPRSQSKIRGLAK
jgi:hypothetical protein